MNKLGIAVTAFTAGVLFGYFAPASLDNRSPWEKCMNEASKRPTDMGVRAAASVCGPKPAQ